uniref:Putative secreted peptide n=1 Tax=Anopheles braziliensis TaxID=58242 RepID=A0A2M3ZML7_9DIPT
MLLYLLVGIRVCIRVILLTHNARTQWTRMHLRRFNVGIRVDLLPVGWPAGRAVLTWPSVADSSCAASV